MSKHEQSGVFRVYLNIIPQRQCWSCTYRKLNVFIAVCVLNVVGIHEPIHE